MKIGPAMSTRGGAENDCQLPAPGALENPMCGRYSLTKKELRLVSQLPPAEVQLHLQPRFNIAPTQNAPVIIMEDGQMAPREMRWGLQPAWSPGPIINARAETLTAKPAFRRAFLHGRCLVPADGFYEWRRPDKAPFRFVAPEGEAFCFAGIWDQALVQKAAGPVRAYAILTTGASAEVLPIHARMPLILAPADYGGWLADGARAEEILRTPCAARLRRYPVSTLVNSPLNEDPRCVEQQN
ncbi:MAG: SOS response-associated peptidase [Verrucomicrobiota bacterium]